MSTVPIALLRCAALAAGLVGTALVLDDVAWFRRRPLHVRVAPYLRRRGPRRPQTSDALASLFEPILESALNRVVSALGVDDDLAVRLERAGRPDDASSFRLRQLGHAVLATAAAVVAAMLVRPPLPAALGFVAGAAVLAPLLDEHRLAQHISERRERLRAELVVVVEQLGMLLGAGYSVTGSIARVAERSSGIAAADLRRVGRRIRGGLSDTEALAEWAERSDLDEVRRLVGVLALHNEAGDLGALIATESRSLRAAAHRDLLEQIERRSQLVWVPVTVATLVPGLLFLAVPFMSAMDAVVGT